MVSVVELCLFRIIVAAFGQVGGQILFGSGICLALARLPQLGWGRIFKIQILNLGAVELGFLFEPVLFENSM